MSERNKRLHVGQLAILWIVASVISWVLFQIAVAIDLPTERVPGRVVPTVREVWLSGPGFAKVILFLVLIAIGAALLRKTWRWFEQAD